MNTLRNYLLLITLLLSGAFSFGQLTVPYSSTPAFNTSQPSNKIVLTGNLVSFTITNGTTANQLFKITVCQNNIGGYVIGKAPANFLASISVSTIPFSCTDFNLIWNNSNKIWAGSGSSNPVTYYKNSGTYSGTIAPTFYCKSPCIYNLINVSSNTIQVFNINDASGTISTNWVAQSGSTSTTTTTNQGPPGPSGPAGPTGATGPNGLAATIGVGSVTTLSPGSNATVVNAGTSNAATLNFGIPRGATGANGSNGVNGSNGATPIITMGTPIALPYTSAPTATITGTAPNYVLTLGIPAGMTAGATSNPTDNTAIAFGAGTNGNASCPTPGPNVYALCFFSGAISITVNGSAYAALSHN